MNIWFTSDTHYSHDNIVKGCSKWSDKSRCRNFNNLHEHNKALIIGINEKVKKDDILYHLGDWSFGGIDKIWSFRKQILCDNVHLILGNHDQHIENNRIIKIWLEDLNKYSQITTHPQYIHESNMDGNPINGVMVPVQTIFKSVQYVKTITSNKQTFFLSHYAHRVWNKSHAGVIHLYGHSHNTIDNTYGKSMDVGIESSIEYFKNPRPFHIDEIIKIMEKRNIKKVDHHE